MWCKAGHTSQPSRARKHEHTESPIHPRINTLRGWRYLAGQSLRARGFLLTLVNWGSTSPAFVNAPSVCKTPLRHCSVGSWLKKKVLLLSEMTRLDWKVALILFPCLFLQPFSSKTSTGLKTFTASSKELLFMYYCHAQAAGTHWWGSSVTEIKSPLQLSQRHWALQSGLLHMPEAATPLHLCLQLLCSQGNHEGRQHLLPGYWPRLGTIFYTSRWCRSTALACKSACLFLHRGGCLVTLSFFLCLQPDRGCYICYCRDSYDDVCRWVSQPLCYWDSPGGGLCLNVCSLQGKHTWRMSVPLVTHFGCSCLTCKPLCSSVSCALLWDLCHKHTGSAALHSGVQVLWCLLSLRIETPISLE